MSETRDDYYNSTRHPWVCVCVVLPLLIIYEVGVLYFEKEGVTGLRNGADTWIRLGLSHVGLGKFIWPGIFLAIGLCIWAACQSQDLPQDLPNLFMGILLESGAFAIGLWLISRALGPIVKHLGIPMSIQVLHPDLQPEIRNTVCFLGAGIYEEIVFRLCLLSGLIFLFQLGHLSNHVAVTLAIIMSSLIFALAHHIGPAGEPFSSYVFLFRTLAGCYFAMLFVCRGLGVGVGAHAGYDLLVGVLLQAT